MAKRIHPAIDRESWRHQSVAARTSAGRSFVLKTIEAAKATPKASLSLLGPVAFEALYQADDGGKLFTINSRLASSSVSIAK
jgi:hypothetical protein